MLRRRLPLSIALLTIGLVLVVLCAGCRSESSGGGRGVKAVEVVGEKAGQPFTAFSLASSRQGSVALAWVSPTGDEVRLKELPRDSWRWADAEAVTSTNQALGSSIEGVAAGYDSRGRLLLAWPVELGRDRWGIQARLRDSDGSWKRVTLVTALPQIDAEIPSIDLEISSGSGSFAVSWSDDSAETGFRVLHEERWGSIVQLEGNIPSIFFPEKGSPIALWIRDDNRLVYAVLGKADSAERPAVLAPADSSLTTSSFENDLGAAWLRGGYTWASIWNGRVWSMPKRLAQFGAEGRNIAIALTRTRAAVAWIEPGFAGGSAYALEDRAPDRFRPWSISSPASPETTAGSVWLAGLRSDGFVLLGSQDASSQLEITHISPSSTDSYEHYSLEARASHESFAATPRAVAYAWEKDPDTDLDSVSGSSIQVWVFRP